MATDKKAQVNIDKSDLTAYPNGRIRDNDGSGNGTPVNRSVYSDLHEFFAKIMRLAEIEYSGVPDNENNGYQLVEAAVALAGKNDFVYDINAAGGTVTIPVKLSILKENESLICRSAFNYAGEGQIKGTGAVIKALSATSSFKAGDYVRLINTNAVVTIVRLADGANMDALVSELLYLKAASEAEEYTGASTSKATTPYTNQLAFARRVIGLDSGMFLASSARNGLMSAADKQFLATLSNPVKNVGWFAGVDPGGEGVGTNKPRSGDVVSAQVQFNSGVGESIYLITLQNAMVGNYFVRIHLQSEGNLNSDDDIRHPVFKIISGTQFQIAIQDIETATVTNLKVHIEAVQTS